MLVYRITLYSIYFRTCHTRDVYVDSPTNEAAERRLRKAFDNLVKFEFLRSDRLPDDSYNYDFSSLSLSSVSNAKRVREYLSTVDSCSAPDVMHLFGIDKNIYRLLKEANFKYSKVSHLYERIK